MDLALFDYDLPPSSIAQEPAEPRDASRLLLLDRARRRWEDHGFGELPALLRSGDCLVVNTSRVIPARLLGELASGGRPVELLLLRARSATQWEALARPARHCRRGARILLAGGAARTPPWWARGRWARASSTSRRRGRSRTCSSGTACRRSRPTSIVTASPKPEDRERYQTVYAREGSSVAAPTAGLHFTRELMQALGRHGVEIHELQLDVGPGHVPTDRHRPGRRAFDGRRGDDDSRGDGGGGRTGRGPRGAGWSRSAPPARARSSGRPARTDASPRAPAPPTLFIHPPYRFKVGGRAPHQLPPAALHAPAPRLRPRRPRAGARRVSRTPSTPGTASTRTATPCWSV